MYFLCGSPDGLDFGDRRDEIALVDDGHAERGQPFAKAGDPEGGRPHVDAAAVAAEVERDADDVNRAHLEDSSIAIQYAPPAPVNCMPG